MSLESVVPLGSGERHAYNSIQVAMIVAIRIKFYRQKAFCSGLFVSNFCSEDTVLRLQCL
jgi:hypothetical protein